jgi:hypothetical protein
MGEAGRFVPDAPGRACLKYGLFQILKVDLQPTICGFSRDSRQTENLKKELDD